MRLKIGLSDGKCKRCFLQVEDLTHLFFKCQGNRKFLHFLQQCFFFLHPLPFSMKVIIFGECVGLDVALWHWIRSIYIFQVWKDRNSHQYEDKGGEQYYWAFRAHVFEIDVQVKNMVLDASEDFQEMQSNIMRERWQI